MNTELKVVLNFISIPLNGIFMYINFSEFYDIYLLKNYSKYEFGLDKTLPYFYKTPELYSIVQLTYGSIFFILLCIGLFNWYGKKMNGYLLFRITFGVVILQLFHAFI